MLSSSNPSSLGNGTKLYMLDLPKKRFFCGIPNAQWGVILQKLIKLLPLWSVLSIPLSQSIPDCVPLFHLRLSETPRGIPNVGIFRQLRWRQRWELVFLLVKMAQGGGAGGWVWGTRAEGEELGGGTRAQARDLDWKGKRESESERVTSWDTHHCDVAKECQHGFKIHCHGRPKQLWTGLVHKLHQF